MTSVLIKGKLGHRDIEQHVNMKAEITAMCLEAIRTSWIASKVSKS